MFRIEQPCSLRVKSVIERLPTVNRRIEDRIRELCSLAIASKRDDERESLLEELTAALREHAQRLKKIAVVKLVKP